MRAVNWFTSISHAGETPSPEPSHSSITTSLLSRIVRGLHPASFSECSQFLSRLLHFKGPRTPEEVDTILKELAWIVQEHLVVRPLDGEKWLAPVASTQLTPSDPALLRPGDSAWPQPSPYPPDPKDRFFRSALPLHERATHCALFRAMVLTEAFWSYQFNVVRAGTEREGFTSDKWIVFIFWSSMLPSETGYEGADLVRLVTAWLNAGLFDTLDALYPMIKAHEKEIICWFTSSLTHFGDLCD